MTIEDHARNTILFSPADIDQLVLQSSRAICETAEVILGRKSAIDKPWITQVIVDVSNEKQTVRNKQDKESKNMFKQLKHQIKKKTCQPLNNNNNLFVTHLKQRSIKTKHTKRKKKNF